MKQKRKPVIVHPRNRSIDKEVKGCMKHILSRLLQDWDYFLDLRASYKGKSDEFLDQVHDRIEAEIDRISSSYHREEWYRSR